MPLHAPCVWFAAAFQMRQVGFQRLQLALQTIVDFFHLTEFYPQRVLFVNLALTAIGLRYGDGHAPRRQNKGCFIKKETKKKNPWKTKRPPDRPSATRIRETTQERTYGGSREETVPAPFAFSQPGIGGIHGCQRVASHACMHCNSPQQHDFVLAGQTLSCRPEEAANKLINHIYPIFET